MTEGQAKAKGHWKKLGVAVRTTGQARRVIKAIAPESDRHKQCPVEGLRGILKSKLPSDSGTTRDSYLMAEFKVKLQEQSQTKKANLARLSSTETPVEERGSNGEPETKVEEDSVPLPPPSSDHQRHP